MARSTTLASDSRSWLSAVQGKVSEGERPLSVSIPSCRTVAMARSHSDGTERFWFDSLSDRLADLDAYFRELDDLAATGKFKEDMAHLIARTQQAVTGRRFKDALLLYHEIEDQYDEVHRTLDTQHVVARMDMDRKDQLAKLRKYGQHLKGSRRAAKTKRARDYRVEADLLIEQRGRQRLSVLTPGNEGHAGLVRAVVKMMPDIGRAEGSAERTATRWIKMIKDRLIEEMNPPKSSAPRRTFGSKRP